MVHGMDTNRLTFELQDVSRMNYKNFKNLMNMLDLIKNYPMLFSNLNKLAIIYSVQNYDFIIKSNNECFLIGMMGSLEEGITANIIFDLLNSLKKNKSE